VRKIVFSLISVLLLSLWAYSQESTEPKSPIHDAAATGDLAGLKQAINKGGGIDSSKDDNRVTPMMLACKGGHLEIVQYLLGAGASLYYQDKDGNYPLHYAAMHADPAVVNFLLEWQGNVTLINLEGKTAIDIARELGNEAVVSALSKVGTYGDGQPYDLISEAETIISDPNRILEDLKSNPDVAAKLAPVQKTLRQEESAWMSRRLTNPSRLARAVQTQVTKEFDVILELSDTSDANEVKTAMTQISENWNTRYDFVGKKLREQMRSDPSGSMSSSTRRTASRRRPTPNSTSQTGGPDPKEEAERALEQDMSSWLQTTSDNRETLCEEVKSDYLNDMMTVREIAKKGEKEKVMLAIDALMLVRSTSLDKNVLQITERKQRDAERNTGYGNTGDTSTGVRRRR
jgi:hypothetical protein